MVKVALKDKDISIINKKYNKYYCKCGHIGEWKDYYNKYRLRCEACGEGLFYYVNVANKTRIYNSNGEHKVELVNPELAKVTEQVVYVVFDNSGESAHVEIDNKEYFFDYLNGTIQDGKREVSMNRQLMYETLADIKRLYNENHEYKINDVSIFDTEVYSLMLQNRNLLILQDFDLIPLLRRPKILGGINIQGTNLESIFKVPTSVVKFLLHGTNSDNKDYRDYTSVEYRYEGILNIKQEYPEITPDELLAVIKLAERIVDISYEQSKAEAEGDRIVIRSIYRLPKLAECLALLVKNRYNIKSLDRYISSIYDYQGLDIVESVQILKDYAQMNIDMNQKYEKYPKSLILAHDITAKNYKFVASEVQQRNIAERHLQNKYLEYESDGLCIIIPKTADEVIVEGKSLHHCVASYISKIASGRCIIAFLRQADAKDTPLGTIEIESGVILQRRGLGNKRLKSTYEAFIKKWAKSKGLIIQR